MNSMCFRCSSSASIFVLMNSSWAASASLRSASPCSNSETIWSCSFCAASASSPTLLCDASATSFASRTCSIAFFTSSSCSSSFSRFRTSCWRRPISSMSSRSSAGFITRVCCRNSRSLSSRLRRATGTPPLGTRVRLMSFVLARSSFTRRLNLSRSAFAAWTWTFSSSRRWRCCVACSTSPRTCALSASRFSTHSRVRRFSSSRRRRCFSASAFATSRLLSRSWRASTGTLASIRAARVGWDFNLSYGKNSLRNALAEDRLDHRAERLLDVLPGLRAREVERPAARGRESLDVRLLQESLLEEVHLVREQTHGDVAGDAADRLGPSVELFKRLRARDVAHRDDAVRAVVIGVLQKLPDVLVSPDVPQNHRHGGLRLVLRARVEILLRDLRAQRGDVPVVVLVLHVSADQRSLSDHGLAGEA